MVTPASLHPCVAPAQKHTSYGPSSRHLTSSTPHRWNDLRSADVPSLPVIKVRSTVPFYLNRCSLQGLLHVQSAAQIRTLRYPQPARGPGLPPNARNHRPTSLDQSDEPLRRGELLSGKPSPADETAPFRVPAVCKALSPAPVGRAHLRLPLPADHSCSASAGMSFFRVGAKILFLSRKRP